MGKYSPWLRVMMVILSIAIMGVWISSATAGGQTFKSPISTGPILFTDGNEEFDRDDDGKAMLAELEQPEKAKRLIGLACVIAARTWFVDEDVCR
jgi:hypothetical protein